MVLGLSAELLSFGMQYVFFFLSFQFYFEAFSVCISLMHYSSLQVHGMLSQMDPALVAYCDKIAAQGGPEHIPDDLGVSTFPSVPVVQLGTVTRASARLRNVQVDVNLDPSHESQKRPKKHVEPAHAGNSKFIHV